jgi:uncharacterized protein YydD (DUF2326 family)
MIRRIFSDLSTFKELSFHNGLNVLVADKSAGATERHTRNRAGKSSLIEILHFLLGGNGDPDSMFRGPALQELTFGMELDLGGSVVRVERSGATSGKLAIEWDTDASSFVPVGRNLPLFIGRRLIKNDEWKGMLGKLMFRIEEKKGARNPSFRSLISYFVRREREGGMLQPAMNLRKQQLVDQQMSISFLLGLDWSIPQGWQEVRDQEKHLDQLKKGLKKGVLGPVVGKAADMKSQLVIAEEKVKQLQTRVASFRVVEQYHELESEASRLTRELAAFNHENTIDRRYVAELEQATTVEAPPRDVDIKQMYREAGIVLPELIKRRFEDVQAFHESVIRNRRSYLAQEIQAARARIEDRKQRQENLDRRRAEIMSILQSAGALEHFTALQAELARASAEIESLRQKYEAAQALESGKVKLTMKRARLVERLHQDYAEQDTVIAEAILTFQRVSSALYEDEKAGNLTIRPTENGPEFDIAIHGAKSKGVNNMQIFCFDLMLMLLAQRHGRSPGFLVHDSHLFDGVDERQVGKALAIGATLAREHGFQYIVTMNTDAVPRDVPVGFSLDKHVLPVRLTDATDDGGLFGFRFD